MPAQLPGRGLITHRCRLLISQTSYLGHKHSGKYIRPNRPDSREPELFDKQLWASLSHGGCAPTDAALCSSITPTPKGPTTPHIQDQSAGPENSRQPSPGLPPQGPRVASLSYCVASSSSGPAASPAGLLCEQMHSDKGLSQSQRGREIPHRVPRPCLGD